MGCSPTGNLSSSDFTSLSQPVSTANENTIAKWIDNKILAPEGLSLEQDNIRYLSGSTDLNKDGIAEHFVLIQNSYFCGSGGCSAVIFDNTGNIISQMSIVKPPVLLADSTNNGWRDFMVWSNGAFRLMKYNGSTYPTNPSLEPEVDRDASQHAAMSKVMETELYQQDGYDLEPLNPIAAPSAIWAPANVYGFSFKHYGDPQAIYHAQVDMASGKVEIKSEH
ncbi:hypothetical protein [Photobacterium gaetbulicola]|nr:hypothetical protein [Photobacterium gaetbulicola]